LSGTKITSLGGAELNQASIKSIKRRGFAPLPKIRKRGMSKKIKIIGTGITGLVGSRIVELLKGQYEFENLSLETGVDISDKKQVAKIINDSPARVVLHLAAKTDVDGCEKDKDEDTKILKEGKIEKFAGLKSAWAVNVEGTRNLVEAARAKGAKIIYISTDFVFDGNKEFYTEEDFPRPVNWYGVSKLEGEKVVISSGIPYLIIRIAFPYRAVFKNKSDIVRNIIQRLKEESRILMVSDQMITPTFIDDIALALDFVIRNKAEGIYQVVGSDSCSPLALAQVIANTFNLDQSLIGQTTREDYYASRAPRPFSLVLKNDKLKKLGFKMSTLSEGLRKVKSQIGSG
jgi:dTDP-4-dehydrorhamnose reductase